MKNSRRAFLKTTIASSAIVASIRPLWGRTEVEYDSTFDPWIEVWPANMRHNANEVSARVGGRPMLAVIKNNGYGLRLLNAAKALEPAPSIAGYAVVKLHETMTLRDASVWKPILLMGQLMSGTSSNELRSGSHGYRRWTRSRTDAPTHGGHARHREARLHRALD